MTGLVLRDAAPDDAPALGRLVVRTWRHAYAELLAHDILEDLDVDERTAAWEALVRAAATATPTLTPSGAWSGTGPPAGGTGLPTGAPGPALPVLDVDDPAARHVVVLVAELADEVVGVAAGEVAARRPQDLDVGLAERSATLPADGALRALYVAPHAQGAGVGRSLLLAATAALARPGVRRVELRTLAGAFWARRLYASAGWVHDESADAPPLAGAPVERWVLEP